ncbi:MAG: esterase/lipase family protein [Gemmataceae bacterium]
MKIAKLRSPIVLVHGLCGFDRYTVGKWTIAEYFPGIAQLLRKFGNNILTPRLSPTRSISERALQLKRYLAERMPNEPVHLIAHSMGGLDARYMISKLGMADRVLSLTTLGTPHRGTAFADWGVQHLTRMIRPLLHFLGIPTAGFYDLTTASCRQFNEEVLDSPLVNYYSVAGEYHGRGYDWLLSYNIVEKHEGPNDGVVSVQSANYGEKIDLFPGDHMHLVNWTNGYWPNSSSTVADRLFGKIVGRLRHEGF